MAQQRRHIPACLLAVLLAFLAFGARGASVWEFDGSIVVPAQNTLFLAADSRGHVYATSFNSRPVAAEIVAIQIRHPSTPDPKVKVFDRFVAPPQRGYAGVAVDGADNIYLSVDAGDAYPSFIRKYLPTLNPDTSFGHGGVLASREIRVLGLTAYKNRILAAVSWGRFLVIDSQGRFLGMTPPPAHQSFVRDIAYVPATRRIYGIDRGGLCAFIGGSLDDVRGYTLEEVVAPRSAPRSGEGIFYSSLTNELFYTNRLGSGLGIYPLDGSPPGLIPATMSGNGAVEPADAVMSPDGRYLYVSDLRAPQVVRYRRVDVRVRPRDTAPPQRPPSDRATRPEAPGQWLDSFDRAASLAASTGQRIVLFCHSPVAPRSLEVERTVLTDKFRKKFPNVLWVKVDAAGDPSVSIRFGVYKLPTLLVFDATGRELERFVGEVSPSQLAAALERSQ